MFMRVSDIAGESKAEGHEDWIDLQTAVMFFMRTWG
jgi:hypothetical protein